MSARRPVGPSRAFLPPSRCLTSCGDVPPEIGEGGLDHSLPTGRRRGSTSAHRLLPEPTIAVATAPARLLLLTLQLRRLTMRCEAVGRHCLFPDASQRSMLAS